jgi:23S rRNA pseudouridine1911/1915/1917 synthase
MIKSEEMEILFEDDFLLAVNKPSGLPSASLRDPDQDTCERRIGCARKGALLLHRLDTGTSGVLLFAKNIMVFNEMRSAFHERALEKVYVACAAAGPLSLPGPLPFLIDLPLAHHPKSKKRMIPLPAGKIREFRGKPLPARTWVLRMENGHFESCPARRIEVRIETGVMHQIRVHLASLGLPLLGDPIYGTKDAQPFTRLALHARTLAFQFRGARYRIEAPEPQW